MMPHTIPIALAHEKTCRDGESRQVFFLIREDLWLLHYGRFVFRFVCGAAALPCEALGEPCGGGVQAVGLDFGLGERVDEAGVFV